MNDAQWKRVPCASGQGSFGFACIFREFLRCTYEMKGVERVSLTMRVDDGIPDDSLRRRG